MIWWVIGVTSAILFILWISWELKRAPIEDVDKDLSRKDQEAEAQGVVDSMRGELDYLRKDGLL